MEEKIWGPLTQSPNSEGEIGFEAEEDFDFGYDEFGVSFLYSGSLWSSLYCGVSSLCVGLYRWLVKVSWLGKLVLVFWWVELDFFSLECNEVSSNEL